MNGSKYEIKVVKREAQEVLGLKVRTSMAQASVDCPTLWQRDFGPRMAEISTFPGESYGASCYIEGESFDYWAALPYRSGEAIPQGMGLLTLPASLYAECSLAQLADLTGAYQHIYSVWGPDSGYDFPLELPSYELYPADYLESGRLILYMPLRLKS